MRSIENGIPKSGKSTNIRVFGPGFMLRTAPATIPVRTAASTSRVPPMG